MSSSVLQGEEKNLWKWVGVGEIDFCKLLFNNRTKNNSHPVPPSAALGPEPPEQRLVPAHEGLFPSGTFVFLAKETVNQHSPKKPGSSAVVMCSCRPAAGIVMGFSQLKKAEPLSYSPPFFPSRKKHLWMFPNDSNVCMTWGLVIVFTLIFTCEGHPLAPPKLGEFW